MHSPPLYINFYHTQSSFPAPFRAFITLSNHPSCLWPSSQLYTSHIGSYNPFYQLVLLNSLQVSIPPQHILLCLTSQLSHISSLLHLLISHSVYTCYSTQIPQTPHLHYINFLNFCSYHTPRFVPYTLSYNFHFVFIPSTTKYLHSFQHLSYIIDPRLYLSLFYYLQ